MKTNQVMRRQLGAMEVQQRTKDAYFNATELLNSYNAMRMGKESNTRNPVYLESVENQQVLIPLKSRCLECAENQGILHTTKRWNVEVVKKQQLTIREQEKRLDVFLKAEKTNDFIESIARNEGIAISEVVKTSRARADRGGGTWVHPLLFIDLCMWLDANFKYKALKFVQDKMLQYRNEAGEAYKELSSAIGRIVEKERMHEVMSTVGKGINYILWNKHEDGERNNHAEESEMRRLFDYERHVAALINDEFITDADQLMAYLRRQWNKKWNPIKALA